MSRGSGVHACRADAGDGAIRSAAVLGLPAARAIRADARELGPPEAFARFVDRCHEAWDRRDSRLGAGAFPHRRPRPRPQFDGTAAVRACRIRARDSTKTGTRYIFNLGRNEVREFLIAGALFWLEHFGVDGLRVDAVASMLYRDYSRKDGEWIPNRYGGRENLESISFLQELSVVIAERCPGALLIAEESTAWPGVTRPASEGGLGFTHKWNMGWMHDTLHFMQEAPINRRYHHDLMTFGLVYAFSEHFVLPISHDEVVHGKYSLLGRMPGDEWQKFANLRAYLSFMWSHPGKKLLFIGLRIRPADRMESRCRTAMATAAIRKPSRHPGHPARTEPGL